VGCVLGELLPLISAKYYPPPERTIIILNGA